MSINTCYKRNLYIFTTLIFLAGFTFVTCDHPSGPGPISKYTVNFETNGGNPAPKSQVISRDSKIDVPAIMTKTGYGFDGWYKEAACTNQWNFAADDVTSNITLYAKWNPNIYIVNFEANGGSPTPSHENIAYGSKVTIPPVMTNTGYGFGGWYKEEACINEWDFTADTVTGEITLYALWDTNYYVVDFETNGGTPVPKQQSIVYGSRVTEPSAISKAGYTFGGWYKEAEFTNQWDFTTDTTTGNFTLYAKWDLNYYTVDFNTDNGKPTPEQQSIDYGGKVTEPPAMSRTGYTFDGWYKEAACTNQWNFATDMVTDNTILYAKWDINYYTVNFIANDGSPVPEPQNIAYGGKVTEPPAMSRTDFNFYGWYKEETYTTLWDFDHSEVMGNIILYAKWGPPIVVSGTTLADKIQWLNTNAVSNNNYIIEVTAAYEDIIRQELFYSGKSNITIQLKGIGSERVIALLGSGSLFTVGDGVTLILGDNLTLLGNSNNISLVLVGSGGNFILNEGAKLTSYSSYSTDISPTNNRGSVFVSGGTFSMNGGIISNTGTNSYLYYGGGVTVSNNGIFTMFNGTIATYSSGVTISDNSTFTMNGGTISKQVKVSDNGIFTMFNGTGNSVFISDNATFTMDGGIVRSVTLTGTSFNLLSGTINGDGVNVGRGIFTMSGGIIEGNTIGAGVSVSKGTFIMTGGTISNNKGGGVSVDNNGSFTMEGGIISNNTVSSAAVSSAISATGGGVSVNGIFTMKGGLIEGNSIILTSPYGYQTNGYGGGVFVNGTFNMSGGTIRENTIASATIQYGGGVYIKDNGNFIMSSGTIESNTARNGGGVCVATGGTFTIENGIICDNIASNNGGGVHVTGTFTMKDGIISGNTTGNYGGGVYWSGSGVFDKTGGIIFGNTDNDDGNVVKSSSDVVQNDSGHAVYISHSNSKYIKRKEATTGPEDILSYIGRLNPPIWSGDWDY